MWPDAAGIALCRLGVCQDSAIGNLEDLKSNSGSVLFFFFRKRTFVSWIQDIVVEVSPLDPHIPVTRKLGKVFIPKPRPNMSE